MFSFSFNGRFSSVGIKIGYRVNGPGIESRWGERFSIPVQTGPGVHPPSCSMGNGSHSRVWSPRSAALTTHPPTSRAEVEERVELYLFPFCAFTACSRVNCTSLFSSHWNTRRRKKVRNKLIIRRNMGCSSNTVPTFRDKLSVLSSKVKNSSASRQKPEITHNPEKLTVDWLTKIVHDVGPSLKI